jgi:hypothetical protein
VTPDPGSGPLRDAGWILFGVLLGSAFCFVVSGGSIPFTGGTASTASLAMSALMLSTLRDRRNPSPAPGLC